MYRLTHRSREAGFAIASAAVLALVVAIPAAAASECDIKGTDGDDQLVGDLWPAIERAYQRSRPVVILVGRSPHA